MNRQKYIIAQYLQSLNAIVSEHPCPCSPVQCYLSSPSPHVICTGHWSYYECSDIRGMIRPTYPIYKTYVFIHSAGSSQGIHQVSLKAKSMSINLHYMREPTLAKVCRFLVGSVVVIGRRCLCWLRRELDLYELLVLSPHINSKCYCSIMLSWSFSHFHGQYKSLHLIGCTILTGRDHLGTSQKILLRGAGFLIFPSWNNCTSHSEDWQNLGAAPLPNIMEVFLNLL